MMIGYSGHYVHIQAKKKTFFFNFKSPRTREKGIQSANQKAERTQIWWYPMR